MAKVVDYEYVQDISIEDVMNATASDNTHGAKQPLPGVNTFKIDGNNIYNLPSGGGEGIAGWSTDVSWSSNTTSLSWGSGNVYLPSGESVSITSGSTNISTDTYIYCDITTGEVFSTTNALESVGENKLLLCVAFVAESGKKISYQAFGCADQSSLATGSSIAAGTITANNIQSRAITASLIAANTITGNEIAANSISANELNVSRLSAISANLGTITAGDISGTTVTAGNINGTAVRLNPATSGRVDFYYGGDNVGYIIGASVDGYDGIVFNCDHVGMTGRDTFDLYGAKLRIPVGNNLY